MKSHAAAGKLQGLDKDSYWYEAAYVGGITNALNVVADALAFVSGESPLAPLEEGQAEGKPATLFAEIRRFHEVDQVPAPFAIIGRDPGYLGDFWQAWQRAFSDRLLKRSFKAALAFAVSVTTRSRFGSEFHLREMKRLGVGDKGIMEILGVTQMFSSYTKIADILQLEPDMDHIAPVDTSPVPERS